MLCPTDASLRGPSEPSPAWKALGRQLNAELTGLGREQLRRCSAGPEQSGQPACREAWSSSLPRQGRSHTGEPTAGTALPPSPCSAAEGTRSTTGPQWPPWCSPQPLLCPLTPSPVADNRLTSRLAVLGARRAVSVHEEQLREPECLAELGSEWETRPSCLTPPAVPTPYRACVPPAATIPLRLRRSPVLKRRPEASGEPRPAAEAGGEEQGRH